MTDLPESRGLHTLVGVPVALAASAHRKVSDPVVVGAQHAVVAEDLVAEGVHAHQTDLDLLRRHPVLYEDQIGDQ